MSDPHRIATEDELRKFIGDEVPGLAEKNGDRLDDFARDYIAKSPFLVLATADAEGNLDASPKGDDPGFVEVLDDETLLIPDRPGNKLAYGHLNVLSNPKVGVIFMIPGTPETLRVNGEAELTADPELLERLAARGKPAKLIIRLRVEEVFFHCAKAFIRSKLWHSDEWPERHKVSFGEMYAARKGKGGDKALAETVDRSIEENYKTDL